MNGQLMSNFTITVSVILMLIIHILLDIYIDIE